jgi:hypothetical protein
MTNVHEATAGYAGSTKGYPSGLRNMGRVELAAYGAADKEHQRR